VLHNGKIYISCGIKNGHNGDHKNWLDRYDPETGNWEILADAPRARDHFQAVLANGSIYLPGGRNTKASEGVFGNTIAEVDVYDPATDSWITLPNNLPTRRAGNSAIFFENKIIVAGGESDTQEEAHSEVEALDPLGNIWEDLAPLLNGRHGTGLLQYDGDLYIASGSGKRGGGPELFSMEKFSE
jgi:N-acetylneuraminic acid mutarotase